MTDKQKQEILANDWLAYIKASLAMAESSKTKYQVIPYKNLKGIRKIKLTLNFSFLVINLNNQQRVINMKTEYILYGLKLNEPDYMEEVIFTSYNPTDIAKAKKLAIKKGYVNFRVATFKMGDMPNFNNPKLINI